MQTANAGGRLDRLPVAKFHYRMLGLIGGGMFLDAFDIYLQAGVLAALLATGWSTPGLNANFVSVTFAGMVVGAWFAGSPGIVMAAASPISSTCWSSVWPRLPAPPRPRWVG